MLLSYIPLSQHLPSIHYNIEKTGLLIINELWKYGGEKRGVTNLHLTSKHYNYGKRECKTIAGAGGWCEE